MATQAIAGRRGYIGFSATSSGSASKLTEVTEYELSVTQDQADAWSNDSSAWNEHVPVTRQWQLTYSIIATSANITTSPTTLNPSIDGWMQFLSGVYAQRWMTLYPSTSSTGTRWRGRVVAESGELSGDVGDVIRADFVYQGHGSLLYSTG